MSSLSSILKVESNLILRNWYTSYFQKTTIEKKIPLANIKSNILIKYFVLRIKIQKKIIITKIIELVMINERVADRKITNKQSRETKRYIDRPLYNVQYKL